MMKFIEKQKLSKLEKRSRNVIKIMKITEKKYKKKVTTRIMGRYWGDKSYNKKLKPLRGCTKERLRTK
jgi:hypothetical protein